MLLEVETSFSLARAVNKGATDNTNNIRVVTLEGNPWFCKDDVAAALGLNFESIKHHVRSNLDQSEKRVEKLPGKKGQGVLFLSESGLYKITLRVQRSNPSAAAFQDWVTKEVLPSIRKTGSFVTGQPSLVENPTMDPLDGITTSMPPAKALRQQSAQQVRQQLLVQLTVFE